MDLYIIGTHHKHQFGPCECFDAGEQACDYFASYLKGQCLSLSIRTVAEEMNADARRKWKIFQTIPESVALKLGIEHADCDPTELERSRLGILNEGDVKKNGLMQGYSEETIQENIRREYVKREDEWIRRVSHLPHDPVIFVCGSDHSSSLLEKAMANGLCVHIITKEWTPNQQIHGTAYRRP